MATESDVKTKVSEVRAAGLKVVYEIIDTPTDTSYEFIIRDSADQLITINTLETPESAIEFLNTLLSE